MTIKTYIFLVVLTIIFYTVRKRGGDCMAKHQRTWNREQNHKYLKEGRGQRPPTNRGS